MNDKLFLHLYMYVHVMKDEFLSSAYIHANMCICSNQKNEKPKIKLNPPKYLNNKLIIKKIFETGRLQIRISLGKEFFS